MEVAPELLESCADMVLQCSDGRAIPCLRFTCLTTCDVIRHLVEDVVLQKDAKGRMLVPFPNIDSLSLAYAVNVLHSVTPVASLGPEAIAPALRGLHALGHSALTVPLMERLWSLVSKGGFLDVQPYINDLLHTPSIQLPVLKRLMMLCPCWPEFSTRVLGAVSMDVEIATWLLRLLVKFFPAGPLFLRLLSMLPDSVLTPAAVLSLFTAPRNSTSFHPCEATDALAAIARRFEANKWDPGLLDFFQSVVLASQTYDVAPHIANAMHGTIVLLARCPLASMLLQCKDRKGAIARKMAPWISLRVDWNTGFVNARITLDKMDDSARYARKCQVRLTAYGEAPACGELWYAFPSVHPMLSFSLVDDGALVAGCPETFRSLMRSPQLARLRIDLFYAEHSVLEKAFV